MQWDLKKNVWMMMAGLTFLIVTAFNYVVRHTELKKADANGLYKYVDNYS